MHTKAWLMMMVLPMATPRIIYNYRRRRPPPQRPDNPYSQAEWDRRKKRASLPPPPLPSPNARCDLSGLTRGVTIVTTATEDRLWNVRSMCERWRGPVSITVGAADTDLDAEAVTSNYIEGCDEALSHVGVVRVPKGTQFPVNQMRNRAWMRARTTHVFLLDADFWPGAGSYKMIADALHVLTEADLALVVPTFALEGKDGARARAGKRLRATDHDSLSALVPRTRDGLLRCLAAKNDSFKHDWQTKGNLYWDAGRSNTVIKLPPSRIRCEPFHHHGSTRFDKWLAATAPEKLSCFLGNFYEPFVVVRNCAVTPRFDERYVGYGKNKLAWITSLRAAGFHFYTVPRAFAVHVPHQVSEEHRLWATHSRAIPQKRVVDDMFFESLFVRKLYADGIRRRYILSNTTASREGEVPTPLCAAAGADVDDIERREKRVNLLPAVARDCLQGACQMSEISRARWARIDATTKNAPDLTACLMAGTRRDEATRECGGGHARRSYARRSRWRAPMHG